MKLKVTEMRSYPFSRALHLVESWTLQAVDQAAHFLTALTARIDAWLERLQQGLQIASTPPRNIPADRD